MAYHFENIKLEKGMYGRSSRSFSQALEELDPSEHYKGTSLEGMDAFQRQLKRFDIKVKGANSDVVEKFFRTADSAVLFPEYIALTENFQITPEGITIYYNPYAIGCYALGAVEVAIGREELEQF